ncbi:testis-expressed protein 45 [Rhinatrema bivittatum]|uniref:testis-expressed protein 45 n=1 Tax=Rhinatrema bivittatum TaxID=194408 RepID=UPI00112B7EC7|nr:testis-expressed protein 45 [Rhinatrema bivittatum]
MTKPPDPAGKQTFSSLVFGDPIHIYENSSGQKSDYQHPEVKFQRYDKQQVVSEITKHNVNPGDGQNRFSTTSAKSYGPLKLDPAGHKIQRYSLTSIPGDRNPETMCNWSTTHHRDYRQLEPREQQTLEERPWEGKKSNLHLGDEKQNCLYYTTSNTSAFQPAETSRVKVSDRSNLVSSVPLGVYKDERNFTEAQSAYVPHKGRMAISEEKLDEIKKSHIIHPWRGDRFLSTTHQRLFTPKYTGPPIFYKTDFQASHLPLGTLGKYIPGCYNALAN